MDVRKNMLDQADNARLQAEILEAKNVQKRYPTISWTDCLKLAKQILDNPSYFNSGK